MEILNSVVLAAVIAAIVAGFFGFERYKRQKIWENINKRYLRDGIENLIDYLHRNRIIIEKNYEILLEIINCFENYNKEDFKNWVKNYSNIKKIFSNMPKSLFVTTHFLKDKNLGKLFAKLCVRCGSVNNFFISRIHRFIENPEIVMGDREIEYLRKETTERYEKISKSDRLYDTIEILEEILFRAREMNINSYTKLKEISEDDELKKILEKFEKICKKQKVKDLIEKNN